MSNARKIPPVSQLVESVVNEGDAELQKNILEESVSMDASGAMTTHKKCVNRVLVDGTVLSVAAALAQNGVALVVCAECRHPRSSLFHREKPTDGILLKENSIVCDSCRRPFCPRHSRRGPDGRSNSARPAGRHRSAGSASRFLLPGR